MVLLPGNRWEGFARDDAEYYICTELDRSLTGEARLGEFFSSGEAAVELILSRTAGWRSGPSGAAIDFGCGVGRLAIPMSRRFGEIRAVDVAPTMLDRLAENARRQGRRNIKAFPSDAGWWEGAKVDFAYSLLVFQHIEDGGEIRTVIGRLGHALAPGAVAYLQFDTRRPTLAYRLRNRLPDGALPATWRRGIRRVRRPSGWLWRAFDAAGFDVVQDFAPDSADHAFVLRRR